MVLAVSPESGTSDDTSPLTAAHVLIRLLVIVNLSTEICLLRPRELCETECLLEAEFLPCGTTSLWSPERTGTACPTLPEQKDVNILIFAMCVCDRGDGIL